MAFTKGKDNPRYKEKITVYCAVCGAEKQVIESVYNRNKNKIFFCNSKCAGKWRSENKKGENCPAYKCGPVKVFCFICGKEKHIKQSEYNCNKDKRFFCDSLCFGKYLSIRNSGEGNYNYNGGMVEVKCIVCGKTKMVHPAVKKTHPVSVCSDKCKGLYNAERYKGENGPKWKPRVETKCSFCGKNLIRHESRVKYYRLQFCNNKCHAKWQSENIFGENSTNWKGGLSFEPYPPEFNERLKEKIRTRDNRTCQLCGMTEKENGKKLDVHHIDYNKDNCQSHNLISLCHYCHIKTNFNRDQWITFFTKEIILPINQSI